MIHHIPFVNIFTLKNVEAIVNPVNCCGVMGKGLAKQFADVYPDMVPLYVEKCNNRKLVIGSLHIYSPHYLVPTLPKFVVNLPTKDHWRNPSTLDMVETSIKVLVRWINSINLTSIAIPPLGCGCGMLEWESVLKLYDWFNDVESAHVYLIYPEGVTLC